MFDITTFPPEILLQIFGYVPYQNLVQSETVCTIFQNIIRSGTFSDRMIKLDKSVMVQVIRTHCFVSFDFADKDLTDTDINLIANLLNEKGLYIKRLNLCRCRKITDSSLKYLTKCVQLSLRGCDKITGDNFEFLSNCSELNLSYCPINNANLKKLSNCKKLDLFCCSTIADLGLQYVSSCTELNLWNCNQITDMGLQNLTNCIKLNLGYCRNITDQGLKYLSNCQVLSLYHCDKITDSGLQYLSIVKS